MADLTRKEVEQLRQVALKGNVLILTETESEEMKKYIDTRMVIDHVDDMGTIHGHWDIGGSLGVIVGVDKFVIIDKQ